MRVKSILSKNSNVLVSVLSVLVLTIPMQESVSTPVPTQKPGFSQFSQNNGSLSETTRSEITWNEIVPIPKLKPVFVTKSYPILEYKAAAVTDLEQSEEKIIDQTRPENYPHGYVPLSGEQAKLYARLFDVQLHANWEEADDLIKKIQDKRLIGHVKFQRLMHPEYKSSFVELKDWMDQYADYPRADRIYKLAIARRTDNSVAVKEPIKKRILSQVRQPNIFYPKSYITKKSRSADENEIVRSFSRKIRAMVRAKQVQEALDLLMTSEKTNLLDNVERDKLKAKIASRFLYSGKLEEAKDLSIKAVNRSGTVVPNASWVAGLALWQLGDFKNAALYFNKVGVSSYASGWKKSAGHFWAARSYEKTGAEELRQKALHNAATHQRTFYGLIAAKQLNKSFDFNWQRAEFTSDNEEILLSSEAGQRAFSLVAAGQHARAESELLRLPYKGNMPLRRAVLSYAMHVELPGIALRLGNMVSQAKDEYYDLALYPMAPWSPKDGYNIDRSLVHAIIRQESRFDLRAKSYSGALGLMQLMPKTAQYIAEKSDYTGTAVNQVALSDPQVNMTLGQSYVQYLLKGKYVKGNMISLLIAYNAGPGNLNKWRKNSNSKGDQLLFIETLPVKETRDYVAKVMSNYWIYRFRAGLNVPSLTALVNDKAPKYAHIIDASQKQTVIASQ